MFSLCLRVGFSGCLLWYFGVLVCFVDFVFCVFESLGFPCFKLFCDLIVVCVVLDVVFAVAGFEVGCFACCLRYGFGFYGFVLILDLWFG